MLGEKLKSLRTIRKLTMEQLSDKLNSKYNTRINKSMISKWENGVGEPSLENIRALASFFDVTLDYLLGIDNVCVAESFIDYETTIAAHHEGEDWTEEELKELEDFKQYVLSKRNR